MVTLLCPPKCKQSLQIISFTKHGNQIKCILGHFRALILGDFTMSCSRWPPLRQHFKVYTVLKMQPLSLSLDLILFSIFYSIVFLFFCFYWDWEVNQRTNLKSFRRFYKWSLSTTQNELKLTRKEWKKKVSRRI